MYVCLYGSKSKNLEEAPFASLVPPSTHFQLPPLPESHNSREAAAAMHTRSHDRRSCKGVWSKGSRLDLISTVLTKRAAPSSPEGAGGRHRRPMKGRLSRFGKAAIIRPRAPPLDDAPYFPGSQRPQPASKGMGRFDKRKTNKKSGPASAEDTSWCFY